MAWSKPSPSPRKAGPRHSGRLISRRITKLAFSSTLSPFTYILIIIVILSINFQFGEKFSLYEPKHKILRNPNIFLLQLDPNLNQDNLFLLTRNLIVNRNEIDKLQFFLSNVL